MLYYVCTDMHAFIMQVRVMGGGHTHWIREEAGVVDGIPLHLPSFLPSCIPYFLSYFLTLPSLSTSFPLQFIPSFLQVLPAFPPCISFLQLLPPFPALLFSPGGLDGFIVEPCPVCAV